MTRFLTIAALVASVVMMSPGDALAADDWRAEQARQIAIVHRAVERYRDVEVAKADGWTFRGAVAPLMGEHWSRADQPVPVAGEPIDFSRPANLMYTDIGGRMELVGVAFLVRLGDFDPLPEGFAGPEDVWHVHNLDQILGAVKESHPLVAWFGRRWIDNSFAPDGRRRLAMVHLWLDGRSADSPFADRDRALAYRRAGLPNGSWYGHSMDAAFGIAIAHPDGCDEELDGKLWLSGANWIKRRKTRRACKAAAEMVRAHLTASSDQLARQAEIAWAGFQTDMSQILSAEEQQRIASLVEAGCGGN
ncbi:MAG: hypothetical protein AAFV19_00720 [Pseudomonadota bacterium]